MGNEVVTIGPYGTKVATVVQVDSNTGRATKPIVCKVDVEAYEEEVKALAMKAELKRKIDARVKALTEGAMLKLLAQSDPELAGLLKQQSNLM